jgi:hypothetical protein
MSPGKSPFDTHYKYTRLYCAFTTMFMECKWYEFLKKKTLKEEILYWQPLMNNELKEE